MQFNRRSWLFAHLVRSMSGSLKRDSSHYDVLGLTPKATQNDIKSAYYKLSMVHHPDKSDDDTSGKKFRAISEAYEVLGNVRLKKMYDKGLLGGVSPSSTTTEPQDPSLKFYKSHSKRQVTPTFDGRTPIYDFDAWSRHHYNYTFKKSEKNKSTLKNRQARVPDQANAAQQEATLYVLGILVSLFVLLIMQGKADYDLDATQLKDNEAKKDKS